MELDETMFGYERRLNDLSRRKKCGAPHNPLVEIHLMEDVTALSAPIFCIRKRISAAIAGAGGGTLFLYYFMYSKLNLIFDQLDSFSEWF